MDSAGAAVDRAPQANPQRSTALRNKAKYKNKGLTSEQLRKRRESDTAQLRKQKRDGEFCRRRNISNFNDAMMDEGAGNNSALGNGSLEKICDPVDIFNAETLRNIFSDDSNAQETALKNFKRFLTPGLYAPADEAFEFGLVARFVTLLRESPSDAVRRDCLVVLSEILAGWSSYTDWIVELGILPILLQLISSGDNDFRSHALCALGNIAGDREIHRDQCIQLGAVDAVIRVLGSTTVPNEVRSAVWTLSNFCRGKNPPPEFEKVCIVLPSISKLLFSQDPYTVTDACRTVALLSDGSNAQIEYVVQSGVVRRLVELLLHPSPNVSSAALRAVGNIVTGTDQQTQVVLSCSALSCLLKLLLSGNDSIKREVCWTLSNILAGNRKQVQEVIDAHLLPPLIDVLSNGDFKTRKEACWAISNALSGGSASQVAVVVREGAVAPLCDLLTVMEPRIVSVALTALDNILKHGENIKNKTSTGINPYCALVEEAGGVDKLEFLQQSPNLEVYVKAFEIIETYFGNDEHNDVSLDSEKATGNTESANGDQPFSF